MSYHDSIWQIIVSFLPLNTFAKCLHYQIIPSYLDKMGGEIYVDNYYSLQERKRYQDYFSPDNIFPIILKYITFARKKESNSIFGISWMYQGRYFLQYLGNNTSCIFTSELSSGNKETLDIYLLGHKITLEFYSLMDYREGGCYLLRPKITNTYQNNIFAPIRTISYAQQERFLIVSRLYQDLVCLKYLQSWKKRSIDSSYRALKYFILDINTDFQRKIAGGIILSYLQGFHLRSHISCSITRWSARMYIPNDLRQIEIKVDYPQKVWQSVRHPEAMLQILEKGEKKIWKYWEDNMVAWMWSQYSKQMVYSYASTASERKRAKIHPKVEEEAAKLTNKPHMYCLRQSY